MISILIVDDTYINRYILGQYIKRYNPNIQVTEAKDGQEAINLVTQDPTKFKAIFMDLIMPVKNGIETTQELMNLYSQLKHPFHPYIIGVTGMIDQDTIDNMRKCGMKNHVLKPISRELLLPIIDDIVLNCS